MASFRDYVRYLAISSCVLFAGLLATRAHAEPLSAVVRVTGAEDERLVARVKGQTSDLELTLRTRATAVLEPTLAEQLSAARRLAAEADAALAIWFVHTEPAIEVVVVDVRVERVLVRSIAGGGGPLELSAREEAAALVVRSAVKASMSGDALGEPEQQVVPPQPAADPKPVPVEFAPPPPPAVRRAHRWLLGAGGQAAIDGVTNRGHYGLFALLALTPRRFELGVRGALGLRAPVDTAVAELAIAEHSLGAYAGYAALSGKRIRLTLAFGASYRLVTTRVRSQRADFVAATEHMHLATIDGEARLTYSPAWAGGHVGLALAAGLSAFPTVPAIGYRVGQRFVPLDRAWWPVQPLLALALVVHR